MLTYEKKFKKLSRQKFELKMPLSSILPKTFGKKIWDAKTCELIPLAKNFWQNFFCQMFNPNNPTHFFPLFVCEKKHFKSSVSSLQEVFFQYFLVEQTKYFSFLHIIQSVTYDDDKKICMNNMWMWVINICWTFARKKVIITKLKWNVSSCCESKKKRCFALFIYFICT